MQIHANVWEWVWYNGKVYVVGVVKWESICCGCGTMGRYMLWVWYNGKVYVVGVVQWEGICYGCDTMGRYMLWVWYNGKVYGSFHITSTKVCNDPLRF